MPKATSRTIFFRSIERCFNMLLVCTGPYCALKIILHRIRYGTIRYGTAPFVAAALSHGMRFHMHCIALRRRDAAEAELCAVVRRRSESSWSPIGLFWTGERGWVRPRTSWSWRQWTGVVRRAEASGSCTPSIDDSAPSTLLISWRPPGARLTAVRTTRGHARIRAVTHRYARVRCDRIHGQQCMTPFTRRMVARISVYIVWTAPLHSTSSITMRIRA